MPHTSNPLTVFEHEHTEGFGWTLEDCAALERLRRKTGADVLRPVVLPNRRRELRAGSHVGVVRLGKRAVQVLPKIYRRREAPAAERAAEATANLLHLLAYASRFDVREHDLAPLLRRGGDWFEILTRLFATHLLAEWQRGAHRHYQPAEDVLPVLKGKWLVGASLRRPWRAHLFDASFDEFTADTALNRVFRFVAERLWRATRDGENRRLLGELRQWMDEVRLPTHLTAADAAPALVTRLNRRFEPLLNLARLFLARGSLQTAAADFETFSFVFDMNRLFESFLVGFITRHRREALTGELRDCELLPQSAGAVRHLARREPDDRPVFRLKPDLAFRRGSEFPLLLDAKYKRLDPADARLGVSPADFYQMHAYARRYDSARVLLLYPQTAEMPERLHRRFALEGTNKRIEAATLDLRVELGTRAGKQALCATLRDILSPAPPREEGRRE
jgi:5-methylcytosine-specific restriction enzyme subunit McrC